MVDPKGNLVTPVAFGPNGEVYAFRVNASGELLAVISGGSGEGTPALAMGKLVTPVAFDPDNDLVALSVDEYGYLKIYPAGIVQGCKEGCRVYNDADIVINTDKWTSLTFNTERFDTDNMHSIVENTERITFTTAGVYVVTGSVFWEENAVGWRTCNINFRSDPLKPAIAEQRYNANVDQFTAVTVTTLFRFSAGDHVELRVYQTSGGDLKVLKTAFASPEFGAYRLGD